VVFYSDASLATISHGLDEILEGRSVIPQDLCQSIMMMTAINLLFASVRYYKGCCLVVLTLVLRINYLSVNPPLRPTYIVPFVKLVFLAVAKR
jgi:hypothetical protein